MKISRLTALGLLAAAGILLGAIYFGRREAAPPVRAEPVIEPSEGGEPDLIRITVDEEGMYLIEKADLVALGWGETDPSGFGLLSGGAPQALWVGENGDLVFYGEPYKSRFTEENVYFLTSGGPPHPFVEAVPQESSGDPVLTSVPGSVSLEENRVYYPRATDENYWYWHTLTAPGSQEINFQLEGLGSGPGVITLAGFARTEAGDVDPDHHLTLSVNGVPVADHSWDGLGPFEIEAPVPGGILKEKGNTLVIDAPGDTGVAADIVLIDRITVDFPLDLEAGPGQFLVTGTTGLLPNADFTLYEVTDPKNPARYDPEAVGEIGVELGDRFLAVRRGGYLTPLRLQAVEDRLDLRDPAHAADYIAVGPPDLLDALQPLLDFHRETGVQTLAVPVSDIYDQFNGGRPEPEAIRRFLQYAREQWRTPPAFLLLAGDATHDPVGYLGESDGNRVPSFFIETIYGGETVSDVRFALLDDDMLPDLAVGRMPARSAGQLKVLVAKTLAYLQDPPSGDWQGRILALADGQEAAFQEHAGTFLGYFSSEYTPVLLAPEAGADGVASDIANELDRGVLMMSYFGHGSITQLGKDTLFSAEDGAGLSNRIPLPVMVNITCLAGLFTHPEVESLTEAILWNPNGGAISALSATSLTTPADQAHLSRALVESMMEDPHAPLGIILMNAQRKVPVDQAGAREVVDTFLLFGDPALVLLKE